MLCNLLNKLQGGTADNVAANTELFKILPDFVPQNQHFRVMAHILNLGVEDLMINFTLKNNF